MQKHQGDRDPLGDPKDGHILTLAIIDTIHEPLIVLDEKLRVITASHSFYEKFQVDHATSRNRLFYDLGNGEWNIPALRKLLEEVIPDQTAVEDYEVIHNFTTLGTRTMLVNAREIHFDSGTKRMLLSIFDITEQRVIEAQVQKLIEQKNSLLDEMRHRIANSLQLIASILLLKADGVASEEARAHLEDAHERIMSIATVQRQLDPAGVDGQIEVRQYLTLLCESLAKSMIGGRKPITLLVQAGPGSVTSEDAISFGLLTTELVINALKYAFPSGEGQVTVTYNSQGRDWTLSISDNGVGYIKEQVKPRGLGTSIVASIANQLNASLVRETSPRGTTITLTHSSIDTTPRS